MEEKDGLQDILLDKNDDERSSNIKKILISVAGLIILFILVLIIMRVLNSNPANTANTDESLVLPSEPKSNTEIKPANTDIFEQVPIANETAPKDELNNIVSDYKKQQENNVKSEVPSESLIPKDIVEPSKTPAQKPKVTKKVEVVKKVEKIKEPTKKNAKINIKEPIGLKKGNYIQVASLSKVNANDPFLKKLKSNGYNYHTYEANVKGNKVIKILIGPYEGEELVENISKIRKNISSGAFIYRVK